MLYDLTMHREYESSEMIQNRGFEVLLHLVAEIYACMQSSEVKGKMPCDHPPKFQVISVEITFKQVV